MYPKDSSRRSKEDGDARKDKKLRSKSQDIMSRVKVSDCSMQETTSQSAFPNHGGNIPADKKAKPKGLLARLLSKNPKVSNSSKDLHSNHEENENEEVQTAVENSPTAKSIKVKRSKSMLADSFLNANLTTGERLAVNNRHSGEIQQYFAVDRLNPNESQVVLNGAFGDFVVSRAPGSHLGLSYVRDGNISSAGLSTLSQQQMSRSEGYDRDSALWHAFSVPNVSNVNNR